MVSQKQDWERGLQVGDPEYWDLLERSLLKAKMLLWKRLQHGAYADDEEAGATMKAYQAIKRVVALLEKKIRQPTLPETPLDTLTRHNEENAPLMRGHPAEDVSHD